MSGHTPWPCMAWTSDPATGSPGMTHATYSGEATALCGKTTPYLDSPWPPTETDWSHPYARCPACAQLLHHH